MGDEVRLTMYERAKVNPEKVPEILEKYQGELTFKVETNPYFIYRPRKKKAKEAVPVMEKTGELLQKMQILLE